MSGGVALERVRIVLSRTSHPGNIGAAARAMKTMGFTALYLVEPGSFPDPVADARASGADDILRRARVVGSLEEALHGTVFSAAVTGRRREWSVPARLVREAAPDMLSCTAQGDVALVFGTETSGLTNDEVALCSVPVTIPANPDFPSLNLGAAVQLLCYELRMAALDPVALVEPAGVLATFEEIEGFHWHLLQAMIASGFHNPDNPKRLVPRVRRLFGRIRLEREEINILRGILGALERKPD
ncbi:MAG TPA: RNA methyltransferase [Rhodocyclaceae bacterium]|nr:RNA methyltransferase [Rhodocyclaceae bacterium]HRQ46546.1 RNA methyltransferase [Rhodocyclaceae bacterium]